MSKFSVTLIPYPAAGSHVYGADTLDEAVETSRRVATKLFASDPARESVRVEIDEACPVCDGTGHRFTKVRRIASGPCTAKGCVRGFLPTVSTSIILRPAPDRAPVCPRCLDLVPGEPGGSPEEPHPGPFTDTLCAACVKVVAEDRARKNWERIR